MDHSITWFDIFCAGLLLLGLVLLGIKESIPTEEELEERRKKSERLEAELKDIYWHISEIERLSVAKTLAIQAGEMEEFKKLDKENTQLKARFRQKYGSNEPIDRN